MHEPTISRIIALVVSALGACALSACDTGPTSGTITEMEHEAEEWESGVECLPGANGTVKCEPWTEYEPETWCVWFEDAEGEEGSDCVSEEVYATLEVGDFYDENPNDK